MTTRIPVQFELPSAFVSPRGPEYIPPATHNPLSAEARREVPAGTLIVAQQYLGAVAAGLFVQELVENGSHEDQVFGAEILSAALLGSTRLSLRGGQPVMRRHLNLPIIADPDTDMRLGSNERIDMTIGQLEIAADLSEDLYRVKRATGRASLRLSHLFGRTAGDAALWVTMLPHNEIGPTGSTADVQHAVRQVAMNTLDTTRRLGEQVGAPISLAMLGGPVTNLTAYIEQRAPHGAYNALRSAQSDAAMLVDIQ